MIKQHITLNKLFKTWETLINVFRHYKIDGVVNFEYEYGDEDDICYLSIPYYDITDYSIIDNEKFNNLDTNKIVHILYDSHGVEYTLKYLDYDKFGLKDFVNNYEIYPIIAKAHDKISDDIYYFLLYGFDMDTFKEMCDDNIDIITDFLSCYDANLIKLRKDTYL